MPVQQGDREKLQHLTALAGNPDEQAVYAAQLVEHDRSLAVVQAALDVLTVKPRVAARPALLKRYAYLADDGIRRDAGGYTRVQILAALRSLGRQDDVPLFERAVCTYEFSLIDGQEVGQVLRVEAITGLGDLDSTLADFHAARLLLDQYTAKESGEPALTAVRVLASHDTLVPLYALVMHFRQMSPAVMLPEIVAEALRNLTRLPASLFPPLLDAFKEEQDEVLLLGLFDLLLARGLRAPVATFVTDFMRTTRSRELHRYVVSTIVANWREDLLDALPEIIAREPDRTRLLAIREALSVRAGYPRIDALLETLPQEGVPRRGR